MRVLTYGARKYTREVDGVVIDGSQNWRLCEDPSRYLDAALRHVVAWRQGESADPETGESHLAHAICCLLFLASLEGAKDGKNGRDAVGAVLRPTAASDVRIGLVQQRGGREADGLGDEAARRTSPWL